MSWIDRTCPQWATTHAELASAVRVNRVMRVIGLVALVVACGLTACGVA